MVTAFYVTMKYRNTCVVFLRLTEIRRLTISRYVFIGFELGTYYSFRPNTSYNEIALRVGTINPKALWNL